MPGRSLLLLPPWTLLCCDGSVINLWDDDGAGLGERLPAGDAPSVGVEVPVAVAFAFASRLSRAWGTAGSGVGFESSGQSSDWYRSSRKSCDLVWLSCTQHIEWVAWLNHIEQAVRTVVVHTSAVEFLVPAFHGMEYGGD